MKTKKLIILLTLLVIATVGSNVKAHSTWREHVNDMMEVFGFEKNPKLTIWLKFISSEMIDKPGTFYVELKEKHPGFTCKHRALFHWGYNAVPWNNEIEKKVKVYCKKNKLDEATTIATFKAELKAEQKRRNALINEMTENTLGFAHGGKDAGYANFFASMAYNTHLVGDYLSDNTDFDGLPSFDNIVGQIVTSLRSFNLEAAKR